MTQQEYTAALATYIPKAEAWADQETGVCPSNRKNAVTKWDRHYAFYMDEVRRNLGRKMSYDLCPSLLRLPHHDKGMYSKRDVAQWVAMSTSASDLTSRFCDAKTAKDKFGVRTWPEVVEAAKAYLADNPLNVDLAEYRGRITAFMTAATP